ncbi:hypothetical protein Tco_0704433 [Tanacetum coccineum]|uniref:Uncharacterized protein n=1 Tax=Tanacetum coccineum TaxID=301880 RepID=A0ABQ4Y3L2_9ASTR
MCRWGGWGLGEGAEWRRRGRNGVRETEGMERAGGGWAGDEKGRWVTGGAMLWWRTGDDRGVRRHGAEAPRREWRAYASDIRRSDESVMWRVNAVGAGLQHTVAEADDGVGKGEASRGRRESSEAGSVGRRVGEVMRRGSAI